MRLPSFHPNHPQTRPAFLQPGREEFLSRLLMALLVLGTVAVYWPVLGNGFVYDDEQYVIGNPHVTGGLTLKNLWWALGSNYAANWHPITWMSHMLDCQLFGLNPMGPHLVNLLLHAANTLLVFVFLRGATGSLWRSFMVAAFFGWHPLHVESVAWIAERKDVLSAFFGLLTLIFYVRYVRRLKADGRESDPASRPLNTWASTDYWVALLFFALGLMSKPMLVTWPFVLLLLDYWPLKRIQNWKRLVLEKAPFSALVLLDCVMTFVAQRHGGAMVPVENTPISIRMGNATISYCSYLWKLLCPDNLCVLYPYPTVMVIWKVLLAVGVLLGISGYMVMRRQRHPFLLMGWLWYCGTLVPVIGLVQVGPQAMADRYSYIPSLGVFVAIVWVICALTQRWRYQAIALSVGGGAVLVLCAGLTRHQIGYWRDGETLFRRALAVSGDDYNIRFNLAFALERKGLDDAAIREYQHAISLNPDYRAYLNIGLIYMDKGQFKPAIDQFQEALRLQPSDAKVRYNLGSALTDDGQIKEAIGQLQEAVRLQPDYAEAWCGLGIACYKNGQVDEAISQFQKAIHLNPDNAEACYNLGVALNSKGQVEAAIARYQEAIRLKPDYVEAHYNLGNALFRMGRMQEAANEYQEVLRLQPDNADALNNLGIILYQTHQLDAAISRFQEAIRLRPDFSQAQSNLQRALAKQQAASGH